MNEIRGRPTLREFCQEHKEQYFQVFTENKKRPVYIGNGFMALFLRIFYLDFYVCTVEFDNDVIKLYVED